LFSDKEDCGNLTKECKAKEVFDLLRSFWPAEADIWEYRGERIPFWKLLQWTTYSLIDVLEKVGYKVTDQDELTSLAE